MTRPDPAGHRSVCTSCSCSAVLSVVMMRNSALRLGSDYAGDGHRRQQPAEEEDGRHGGRCRQDGIAAVGEGEHAVSDQQGQAETHVRGPVVHERADASERSWSTPISINADATNAVTVRT
ncbi:MAG: hypothetical protein QOE61_6945 [Micromonosporaceae bacterium]|nr:hypothetical protein [Micromonosporaceae bacterium]